MSICHSWNLDDLIGAYQQHLRRTRGLREKTVSNYTRHARALVSASLGEDPVDAGGLTTTDVVEFVTARSLRWSPASMKSVRTALRSFLRWLRVEGLNDQRLETAIPRSAHWRLSTLPRRLSEEQLSQLVASLVGPASAARPCAMRDAAIVWCLAMLGLRPSELAGLRLDDIDWRGATIQIRERKNRRGAVVPLPAAAGRAVAAYLSGDRPVTGERRVFVQQMGPRRGEPIKASAVSEVVTRALRRAGIDAPMAGGYVLRHTVASRMVTGGASLKEVADVLGHRDLGTTAIYAKLDVVSLRAVALPWPEVAR